MRRWKQKRRGNTDMETEEGAARKRRWVMCKDCDEKDREKTAVK